MTVEACRLLLIVAAAAAGASLAAAETVVCRQGADGYAGCTTKVRPGPGQKGVEGIWPVRGSANALEVRFELPKRLAGKDLVRARLGVFLPSARKPNFFTEVLCREIVDDEGGPDTTTDYDNGRPPGVVDSVELFAPPHKGWGDFPWLPRGVPEGGAWIEFNVTPLVEKWLKDPSTNRGVVLLPTDPPKKGASSTWEIDVPAADFAGDPGRRPRLTLELGPPEGPCRVGFTDGMVQVLDRSTRFAYRGGYGRGHQLAMAANELEGFQVVLFPTAGDLKKVRFTWTDLTGGDGKSIPAADVECFIEEWYKLRANKETEALYAGKLYEVPDPLVPARPVTVRRHRHTPFYFRVRTRPDTPPGDYRGTITVAAEGIDPIELDLTVTVWPFALPERWNFHTMGQFIQGTCQRFHGKDWGDALRRKYSDFLLLNRFSPTEQYAKVLSPRQDLAECLARGMNTVYLSGNFTGTDEEIARLKTDCAKVVKLGALDYALVYIGDETKNWEEMHRRADLVHAHLPGAMVMIGGSRPRKELIGYVDIYDPVISAASKTYGFTEDDAASVKAAQQRGEEFYWYVCVAPSYPYPNVMMEYPPVIGRVLFWMTWKYGVTGFEYYCYNIWRQKFDADPSKRFPHVKWRADGFKQTNADGLIFYPGPTGCLRLEAMRDGIEEWEMHQLLADCVAGLRRRKHAGRHRALLAKAEKLLAVKDDVVAGLDRYTTDPARLLAAREDLGGFLAKVVPVAEKTLKWDTHSMRPGRAAEVRIAARTARRRRMLRRRHLEACKRLKVEPISQEAFDELWPRRVLFSQDFESAPGEYEWDGEIVTDNVPPGSKRALLGHTKDKKHFGRRVRVGIYWDNARAATHTWVTFKYHINKPLPIGVFVFDMNKSDNFRFRIAEPVVGKWTEATIKVADPRRRGKRIEPGDALDDVFIHAGKPGDEELKLYVDDVRLIGRD